MPKRKIPDWVIHVFLIALSSVIGGFISVKYADSFKDVATLGAYQATVLFFKIFFTAVAVCIFLIFALLVAFLAFIFLVGPAVWVTDELRDDTFAIFSKPKKKKTSIMTLEMVIDKFNSYARVVGSVGLVFFAMYIIIINQNIDNKGAIAFAIYLIIAARYALQKDLVAKEVHGINAAKLQEIFNFFN